MLARRMRSVLRPALLFHPRAAFSSVQCGNFPYKFGNTSDITPWPANGSSDIVEYLNKFNGNQIRDGIGMAYLAMLTAIQDKDSAGLREMVEGRLFKRLQQEADGMRESRYEFILRNRESKVRVTLKGAWLIIGWGNIDRDTEYSERATLLGTNMPNVIAYRSLRHQKISVIMKIRAEIRSACKLDVKDPKSGETLVSPQEANDEEVHELCVEGIVLMLKMQNFFSSFIQLIRKLVDIKLHNKMDFSNATIVDLDNALKGNCHKDSTLI